MDTNNNKTALDIDSFNCRLILSPNQKFLSYPFENFDALLKLASEYKIQHLFIKKPVAPEYPSECLSFFTDTRRCSFDVVNNALSGIDTLKVTQDDIAEQYSTSLRLNAKCGDTKILDQKLISDLQDNKPIYLFFVQGFLRACSEQEAQGFITFFKAADDFRKKIIDFEILEDQINKAQLKAKTMEQAQSIDSALGVKWRGVFAIQYRLLHEKNHFGSQKKTTVAHVRLLDDYQKDRLKRISGQTLCGAKSKFGYSDDMSDLNSYLITCPKCLAMIGLT